LGPEVIPKCFSVVGPKRDIDFVVGAKNPGLDNARMRGNGLTLAVMVADFLTSSLGRSLGRPGPIMHAVELTGVIHATRMGRGPVFRPRIQD
jgi:hypothetical protein